MAFSVQDDAGSVADANAYLTVASFKSYHDDRGNDYLTYSDDEIERAIVAGSDYLDSRWCFIGTRCTAEQSTAWPRRDAVDSSGFTRTGIIADVTEAAAEYAFIALSGELNPTPDRDSTGRDVVSKREKVGSIEEETKYAGSALYAPPEYPVADRKLRRVITASGWSDRG